MQTLTFEVIFRSYFSPLSAMPKSYKPTAAKQTAQQLLSTYRLRAVPCRH